MEFNHGTELLELCEKNKMPISLVMKKREAEFSGITEEEVEKKMRKAWKIMKESARKPLKNPVLSIGGLIGGEAKKLKEYHEKGRSVCGDLMSRAITYAMAVLEAKPSNAAGYCTGRRYGHHAGSQPFEQKHQAAVRNHRSDSQQAPSADDCGQCHH